MRLTCANLSSMVLIKKHFMLAKSWTRGLKTEQASLTKVTLTQSDISERRS